jgi:hypothetical protein
MPTPPFLRSTPPARSLDKAAASKPTFSAEGRNPCVLHVVVDLSERSSALSDADPQFSRCPPQMLASTTSV